MLQGNWQPPSHSFYHVHVFSDIELWCFSFVTLFNLQGTRPVRSAAEHLLSYHTLSNLSSAFFNFFRNLFPHSLRFVFFMLSKKLLHYTRFAFACQVLFSISFEIFSAIRCRTPVPPDSSVSIPDAPWFVKPFFRLNQIFFFDSLFRRPLPHSRAVRQLV